MPSLYSEAVGELIFASDTSGSVVSCQSYFLSEVRNILETVSPEKVRLLYWDDKVQKKKSMNPTIMTGLSVLLRLEVVEVQT